jgi:hypothetical protein
VDHKQFEDLCKQLRERKDDIRPSDVAAFPEPLSSTLTFAVRLGRISLTDLAKRLDLKPELARQLADLLVARNLFQLSPFSNSSDVFFETRLSSMTRPLMRPALGLWKKIEEDDQK